MIMVEDECSCSANISVDKDEKMGFRSKSIVSNLGAALVT